MARRIEPDVVGERSLASVWRKLKNSRPVLLRRTPNSVQLATVDRSSSILGRTNIRVGGRVRLMKGSVVDATTGRIELGDGAVVCRFAVLEAAGGSISVGSNTTIGDYSSIYGQGGLSIGKDVLIASGARIVPSSHLFDSIEKPIREQGLVGIGVTIEDDVWIGTNVIILDGVIIGRGAIIGAGALVNRDVPPYGIAVGSPARVIRYRKEE